MSSSYSSPESGSVDQGDTDTEDDEDSEDQRPTPPRRRRPGSKSANLSTRMCALPRKRKKTDDDRILRCVTSSSSSSTSGDFFDRIVPKPETFETYEASGDLWRDPHQDHRNEAAEQIKIELCRPLVDKYAPRFETQEEAKARLMHTFKQDFVSMPVIRASEQKDSYCMLCCSDLLAGCPRYYDRKACKNCFNQMKVTYLKMNPNGPKDITTIVRGALSLLGHLNVAHEEMAQDGEPQNIAIHNVPSVEEDGQLVERDLDDYFRRPGNAFNDPTGCGRCALYRNAPSGLCGSCKSHSSDEELECVFCRKKLIGNPRFLYGERICGKCHDNPFALLKRIKPLPPPDPTITDPRKRGRSTASSSRKTTPEFKQEQSSEEADRIRQGDKAREKRKHLREVRRENNSD